MTTTIELVEYQTAVELAQPSSMIEIVEPVTAAQLAENDSTIELIETISTLAADQAARIEIVEQVAVLELGSAALQGPPGASSPSYTHVQSVPSDTWVIVHNLGAIPSALAVLDSAGTVCLGQITHDNVNQCTLRFGAAFAGTAYLR